MVTVRDITLSSGTNTTSVTSTFADDPPEMESPGDVAFRIVWRYIAPLIFIIGMVGNVLIVIVMSRNKMRGNTTAIYLPVLAIADAFALFSGIIPEWMEACNIIKFKELSPGTCRFEKIIFYTSADTAIWILVAFTCDRFIAVCFPFRKSRWCTSRKAIIISASLLVAAFIKNMHVFWTRGAQYDENGTFIKNCGYPRPEYKNFERNVRPWLVFVLVNLIPFLVILSCNLAIVYKLLAATRIKDISKPNSKYSQTTLMCVGVSFLFLLTTTPSVVMYIGRSEWDKSHTDAYEVAKAVTNVLVYLNHSLNFFVYCMSGKRFRREFLMFCCCGRVTESGSGLSSAYTIRGRGATQMSTPRASLSASDYYDSTSACKNQAMNVQDLHM
uniref:Orphan G-protein coupled receptor 1 n=1 Tax=Platynereis dumerilii TaxID=6359 RepID=A0A0K0PVM1_PLADU|nr:orphan G-protein coupled receptor 1 [Platynereis dumerilii]